MDVCSYSSRRRLSDRYFGFCIYVLFEWVQCSYSWLVVDFNGYISIVYTGCVAVI